MPEQSSISDFRIGCGIDIHKFASDRKLILAGCLIESEMGLLGHSDADVLLHALTDAILGALAWGDIGSWFPDSDPEYKDADSAKLLSTVWEKAVNEGWLIGNADITVLLEEPKLRPHIDRMRHSISKILDTPVSQISIKATTSEKLGFIGRGEGVLCEAVVLLIKKSQ